MAKLLAKNRSPDSYLAGGAALHFEPNTKRISNDLDYFHDSQERVASAFEADKQLLGEHGFGVDVVMAQPGYILAIVSRDNLSTKLEWAHDSAWRFMPVIEHPGCGYILHPVDLAINKVLALAGRDEPRDLIDALYVHAHVLPLGALCWAAAGKDPGFTPLSLLELLRRRGRVRPEDLERLALAETVTPAELKAQWTKALEDADAFINARPPSEIGCLYYSAAAQKFVAPAADDRTCLPHHGRPSGVLPQLASDP